MCCTASSARAVRPAPSLHMKLGTHARCHVLIAPPFPWRFYSFLPPFFRETVEILGLIQYPIFVKNMEKKMLIKIKHFFFITCIVKKPPFPKSMEGESLKTPPFSKSMDHAPSPKTPLFSMISAPSVGAQFHMKWGCRGSPEMCSASDPRWQSWGSAQAVRHWGVQCPRPQMIKSEQCWSSAAQLEHCSDCSAQAVPAL